MRLRRRRDAVPVVTDAPPSAEAGRRRRQRTYAVVMVIHLVGLAVGGSLYRSAFWVGLVILVVTGPLPWVAVVLANDGPPRRRPGREDPDRPRGR
ncbi:MULTISPECIES: DUF3099 domain-containing protein [unclassified Pseudonocardia]|uniref:DUF3099 domain-containing protein n=1 Tax=unclassified Pseudonocardia TaxID=2619320 RepID=UPI000A6348EB|nr:MULTISPECIES: DUF3099 domain-containing protein [unclassified Pseudonocardia]